MPLKEVIESQSLKRFNASRMKPKREESETAAVVRKTDYPILMVKAPSLLVLPISNLKACFGKHHQTINPSQPNDLNSLLCKGLPEMSASLLPYFAHYRPKPPTFRLHDTQRCVPCQGKNWFFPIIFASWWRCRSQTTMYWVSPILAVAEADRASASQASR